MPDGVSVGRVVAIGAGDRLGAAGPVDLAPGRLRATLTIDGDGVADLEPGSRLRIGAALVEVLGAAGAPDSVAGAPAGPAGGLEDRAGERRPARVLEGGAVRVGDAVLVDAVRLPIEEVLDLHAFPPAEVAPVVEAYLAEALRAGFAEVRIIHGRGRGVQREIVRRLLAASPDVARFADAPPERGGWGATIARLGRPPERRP